LCKLLDISTTNNLWVMLSRIRARLRRCLDTHWFKPTRSET
jgi:RNA polymerase sigma-70 factor (ECF subfamily)